MSQVVQALYKEIKQGDLLKLQNASNVATTGGGARDFRFPLRFAPLLALMFPRRETRGLKECRLGDLRYSRGGTTDVSADVEYWPEPTNARPHEVRIGRVGSVPAFADPPVGSADRVFLELARLDDGAVSARYVTETTLRQECPASVSAALDSALATVVGENALIFAVPDSLPSVGDLNEDNSAGSTAVTTSREFTTRRARTGRRITITTESTSDSTQDETDTVTIATVYNYERQERASSLHRVTLGALVDFLIDLGLDPMESNIDAYVSAATAAILFEVKSLSPDNERDQTRRAIGQLLDYQFFERPTEIDVDADISYAVVYSEQPSDETIEFLESIPMHALWIAADGVSVEGTASSIDAVEVFGRRHGQTSS